MNILQLKFVLFVVLCVNLQCTVNGRIVTKNTVDDIVEEEDDYRMEDVNFEEVEYDENNSQEESPPLEAEKAEITDDGVTCSVTNFTKIFANHFLEGKVLAIVKLNASQNTREFLLFLSLLQRFFSIAPQFEDLKFVVITLDNSSEFLLEFMSNITEFPESAMEGLVLLDEVDYDDFGFEFTLDESHVYTVDPCGKLTYIIVPPWSSATYPYVKAAVLSTIYDEPCGCKFESKPFLPEPEVTLEEMYSKLSIDLPVYEMTTSSASTETPSDEMFSEISTDITGTTDSIIGEKIVTTSNDFDLDDIEDIASLLDNINTLNNNYTAASTISMPMKIIMSTVHMHYKNDTNTYWKYDNTVYKSSDSQYHEHLGPGDMLLEIRSNQSSIFNENLNNTKIFVGNRSISDIHNIANAQRIFVNRQGMFFKVSKNFFDGTSELVAIDFDITQVTQAKHVTGVKGHYDQLRKWLVWRL
ncbi:unnamed protein product [Diamesa serratosioi]